MVDYPAFCDQHHTQARMVGQQGQNTTQFDEPIHQQMRPHIWLVINIIIKFMLIIELHRP